MRNYSNLTKKIITDKYGRRRSVWVKMKSKKNKDIDTKIKSPTSRAGEKRKMSAIDENY